MGTDERKRIIAEGKITDDTCGVLAPSDAEGIQLRKRRIDLFIGKYGATKDLLNTYSSILVCEELIRSYISTIENMVKICDNPNAELTIKSNTESLFDKYSDRLELLRRAEEIMKKIIEKDGTNA